MDEQRKYAILFAATILAARKLNEIGSKPCLARESPSRTQSTRPSSSSKRLIPPVRKYSLRGFGRDRLHPPYSQYD